MVRSTAFGLLFIFVLITTGCPTVPPEITSLEVCEEATDLSCLEDQDVLDAASSSIFVAIDHTGFEPTTGLRLTLRHLEGDRVIVYRNFVEVSHKAQRVIVELPKPAPPIGEWPAGEYEISAELDAPDSESVGRTFDMRSKRPPAVAQLTICEELIDSKCGILADVYGIDEPEIYIVADLVNSTPGDRIEMHVELVDDDQRRTVRDSSLEVESGKAGVILLLTPPRGVWAEGSYEVRASLEPDQTRPTEAEFTIEEGASVAR